MSARKRIRRHRVPRLDDDEDFLRLLADLPPANESSEFVLDDETARQLWQGHGDRLTREHARRRPGTRPVGWWKFEAPEPRRLVAGSGRSRGDGGHGLPYEFLADDGSAPPRWETQHEYLRRRGLLLPNERAPSVREPFPEPPVLHVGADAAFWRPRPDEPG